MSEEGARPQDLGRPHRRTAPGPAPETLAVLDRYRAAMREELGDVLEEIRPTTGQLGFELAPDSSPTFARPPLERRVKLWDLAVKLGRELAAPGAGAELEPDPTAGPSTPATSRPRQAPRLSARERRALGG